MLPIVFHPGHARHDPLLYFRAGEFHTHPEMPSRAEAIVSALRAQGGEIAAPDDFGPGPRADVHSAEYLDFLSSVHRRWKAEPGRRVGEHTRHMGRPGAARQVGSPRSSSPAPALGRRPAASADTAARRDAGSTARRRMLGAGHHLATTPAVLA